jgi:cobalt-zinc-cadmium efflux system outer membrane protein
VQRETAGVAPMLERRIIEASALTLDRKMSETERERQAAHFELNQLRGVRVTAPIAVTRTELPLKHSPELALLLATARERNFDVRTRVVELEQQGFKVKLTENERWPSVTLAPYARGERANDSQREFGLGVTVPLPVLNQNRGNISAAKARQLQAEVMLNVKLREVERKIAEAHHAYAAQLEAIARWQADTVKNLREAAAQADRHYRLGALPIATYTELQKQYLDALEAVLDTQTEALESRQALELLSGLALSGKPLTPHKTTPAKSAPRP